MSRAAISLLVYGIYLAFLGLGFLIMPNMLLAIFGMPATDEVWIRVAAMLLLILAYYDLQAARNELTPFFRFSAHARASVILFFVVFVVLGFVQPIILLLAALDLFAALWTAWALRSETPAGVAP